MDLNAIRAAIADCKKGINQALTDNDTDAAIRGEGRLEALRDEYDRAVAAVEAENERIASQGRKLASSGARSIMAQAFGTREEFEAMSLDQIMNRMVKVDLRAAATSLATPEYHTTDLPALVEAPTGFLATLAKGTTNGDEHFFQQPALTNAAAGWASGTKPESALAWTPDVAHIETIAHWIPIAKQTARRYTMLESLTANALLLGLDMKCDELAIRGSNSSGIVGVVNKTGVLQHTMPTGTTDKNLKDAISTMRRKVRVASGLAATHVCLSPYAIETIAQEKDQIGRYLYPEVFPGGQLSGMTVVEDVNMTLVTTSGGTTTSTEQAIVYSGRAATWSVADPAEVTIGLVDKQFVQNAYTLLAETTALLRFDVPAGFCVCADLGIDPEA
jgi:HK97 family phage major capsid protein